MFIVGVFCVCLVYCSKNPSFYDTFHKEGIDIFKWFERRRQARQKYFNELKLNTTSCKQRNCGEYRDPRTSPFWEYITNLSYRDPTTK